MFRLPLRQGAPAADTTSRCVPSRRPQAAAGPENFIRENHLCLGQSPGRSLHSGSLLSATHKGTEDQSQKLCLQWTHHHHHRLGG